MKELYIRTLNNCLFYEREQKWLRLLNEIGVLRGIVYCLEGCGENFPADETFLHFIELQQTLKTKGILILNSRE